jgi:hypothetical protein
VQIKSLMDPLKAQPAPVVSAAAVPTPVATPAPPQAINESHQVPALPPDITQAFIPARSAADSNSQLVYVPAVFAAADVRYTSGKSADVAEQLSFLTAISTGPLVVDWTQGQQLDLPVNDLETSSESGAQYADIPPPATKAKNYETWKKDFAKWIYANRRLELMESSKLDAVSNPGESERDFRVRLQLLAREQRDVAVEKLRQKYAPKIAQLEEKKRRAEQTVARETEQAHSQKLQTAISFGATLLSSFMGRKAVNLTTLGRATTAARGVGRSMKEAEDVGRAQETVEVVGQQIADLDAQFKSEVEALERSFDAQTEPLEKISLKPTKSNIDVKLLTFAWAPHWRNSQEQITPAWE